MKQQSKSKLAKQLTEADIPKAYDAKLYEAKIYEQWESSGAFKAKVDKKKKPFSIIMPPPNATGTLHLGHAVMLALEDIMVRYHRMKGDSALWIPGTDHAAIATQNKVEKLLAEKGITRFALGRKDFIKEVEKFVVSSQSTIRNQVRKMGSSCDWSRETYTLDAGPSLAVRTVFKRMFDDGLIYRGYRTVNWCTRCQSTLADDEVNYKENSGKLYVFKYDKDFPFEIATTRPETKLADVAVAVHPDDQRYKKYIGKQYEITFAQGKKLTIDIIPEKSVDPTYGTGAVGVTPAHSHIDFDMYNRHKKAIKSEIKNLIDEKGMIQDKTVKQTRQEVVAYLEENGLMKETKDISNNVGACYRCGTTVEVILSNQWFVDVDKKIPKRNTSIKQLSIDAVKSGKIEILPDRFSKIYFHWMNNLHNWCISRQIWFGHQIPVWYCGNCESGPIVEIETPKRCPKCKTSKIHQDPDTLDTWFSSGMWTFSTLGWPNNSKSVKEQIDYFHPTAVLETGYDILFFWVARMIIMTTYALGEVPFKTVYLHGLVRTRNGEKMSKSKPESCIDPLDMIEKYGADALRLSMVIGGAAGNDTRLYEEKIAGYRNFVNKIWNASRFILLNVSTTDLEKKFTKKDIKTTADKWILTRLQNLVKESTKQIEKYNFSEAGTQIYDFLWSDMCDWYIEFSKGESKNPAILIHALKTTLKLLHPFVPFVTEAIWEKLGEKKQIMLESWPTFDKTLVFSADSKKIEKIHNVIGDIRKTKAEYKIDPVKKINAIIYADKLTNLFEEKKDAIMRLANLEGMRVEKKGKSIDSALRIVSNGMEIYLPLENMFDVGKELERIEKETSATEKELSGLQGRLSNKSFVDNAPKEVVSEAQERLIQLQDTLKKLQSHKVSLEKAAKM